MFIFSFGQLGVNDENGKISWYCFHGILDKWLSTYNINLIVWFFISMYIMYKWTHYFLFKLLPFNDIRFTAILAIMSISTFKTVFICNFIMCFHYQNQFVDTDNIARWDQIKNVQIIDNKRYVHQFFHYIYTPCELR
jgi:hypothetical protein